MSSHAHIARQALTGLLATGAACGLGGCSVFSISPAMELLKATGTAASFAVGHAVGSSVDVVRHRTSLPDHVCIVLNEQGSSADFLPALRRGLREAQVSHRLVQEVHPALRCEAWLSYSVEVDWGEPPLGGKVQAHVSRASLTLRAPAGQVLAQVRFEPTGAFEAGRWASTHDKVQSMVRGLWPAAVMPAATTRAMPEQDSDLAGGRS